MTSDAEAVKRLGPYAVAGAVGATLARLGDGPLRLAHAVAVLDRAPLATAARLAGIGSEQASGFAEQLVRAGSCATPGRSSSSTGWCATPC